MNVPTMKRLPARAVLVLVLVLAALGGAADWSRSAHAEGPAAAQAQATTTTVTTLDALQKLDEAQLVALYRLCPPAPMPIGAVKGTVLTRDGKPMTGAMAAGAKAFWQGKVFHADGTAVNRFFGMPAVRAKVYQAASLLDGRPSLILDYSQSSVVYAKNRDEVRQVAPGLLLGLMYDHTTKPPTLTLTFAIEPTTTATAPAPAAPAPAAPSR